MEEFFQYLDQGWTFAKEIIAYKPLWVVLMIVSVTQIGKMYFGGKLQDKTHRLITRLISGSIGALGGFILLTEGTDWQSGVGLGLALSVAISALYVPTIKWLRKGPEGGFKQGLADWLSGK